MNSSEKTEFEELTGPAGTAAMTEEEDTCVSCEEEDTCPNRLKEDRQGQQR